MALYERTSVRSPGLGCMRLSTEPDRDEARATAVLHAAFDAGIELLDTADAYCWGDEERGHKERLIARAIARTRRHERRAHTPRRTVGARRPRQASAKSLRTQRRGARRRTSGSLSASCTGSANAACHERPRARTAQARWPHQLHRFVQR